MVKSHYRPTKFDMVFTFIARPFAYNYFHIYHSDLAMTSTAVARRLKIGSVEKNETRNQGLSSNSTEEEERGEGGGEEEEEEEEDEDEDEEGRQRGGWRSEGRVGGLVYMGIRCRLNASRFPLVRREHERLR